MIRQRGQSMTEFAVGVAALGLLALGSITIAGLQETQRRAIVAAREAAFQGAWSRQASSAATLGTQLARAHFDDAGLTNASGTARLLQPEDVELATSRGQTPGTGATAAQFLFRPLHTAGAFLGGGFDLDDNAFDTGTLSADISGADRMPEPFRQLQLRFTQPYALLGDDWSAAGPQHVARRAGGLVPTHLLAPISRVWQPLATPLGLFEPSLRELCFGLIEPDRVPEDRLGPGSAPGASPC